MRNILLGAFAAITILISFQSCNEDIDLVGDFTETAVIYGLLDKSDSVHYVKITRAFIGPGNALNIAQIPDSNYFNSVDAEVEEWIGGNWQGTEYVGGSPTGRVWQLKDTIITNKDENGAFYAPNQKVYVFYTHGAPLISKEDTPDPGQEVAYKFKAELNGDFTVTATTGLVEKLETTTDAFSYQFKFAKNVNEFKTLALNASHEAAGSISAVGDAHVMNAKLTVHYTEFFGTDSTETSFNWTLGEIANQDSPSATFTGPGQNFYQAMRSHCQSRQTLNPNIDKRNFTGITVNVVGGSEDLYTYMLVNQPSSSLAQNKPTYTNLSATDGHTVIGIFSSRYTHRLYHPFIVPGWQSVRSLDKASTEVLCIGPLTNPYLFCSQHDADNFPTAESWACQ